MGVMELADRAWPLLGKLAAAHVVVYRATGGRLGHRVPGAPAMLLLDHVGARTGTRRTTPLLYFRDGANLVIVASKGGHPRHPAWFHNLRANPDTTVQVRDQRFRVHARIADAAEKRRLWPLALRAYPPYRGYQARTDRNIPLVVLEPAG